MRQARSKFDRKRRSEPSSSFILISLSFFTPSQPPPPPPPTFSLYINYFLFQIKKKEKDTKRAASVGVRKDLI